MYLTTRLSNSGRFTMAVGILSIVFILSLEVFHFSKEEYLNNSCGTIWYETPAIYHRNVSVHFKPIHFDSNRSVLWTYSNQTRWINFASDSHYQVSNFSLVINTALNYKAMPIRVHYGDCESEIINLVLERLTSCGKFYERTTNVRLGETVELGYFPVVSILQHPDRYERIFRVINKSCNSSYGCVISNTAGIYQFREVANSEYVMSINSLSDNVTGRYLVQCTTGRDKNLFTNTVPVAIPVAPNDPILLDTRTIENCEECLSGVVGANTSVRCNVSGGTEPVHVQILIDGVPVDIMKYHKDVFMATVTITNEMHLKSVRCEALNHAIFSPVAAQTRIYAAVTPSDPALTINNTIIGDEIARVTCRSHGARPHSNVTWTVNGEDNGGDSSTSTLNEDNTSTSMATLIVTNKDWNGRTLLCCVTHVTYTGPVCNERQLNVSFPPESLKLFDNHQFTEILPSYLYRVVCVILKSYPKCTPYLNMSPDTGKTIVRTEQTNGEFAITSKVTLQVNVTKSDNGKYITCRATCEGVEYQQIHTISVPFRPVITFNVTTKDINITEGSNVVIKCSAEANPTPHVRWLDGNGTELPSDSQCLTGTACLYITQARKDHSGIYTCTAKSNMSHEVSEYLRVAVLERQLTTEENVAGKEEYPTTLLLAIGGSIGLVVLVVIIAVVFVKKKKNKPSHHYIGGKAPGRNEETTDPPPINYHAVNDSNLDQYAEINRTGVTGQYVGQQQSVGRGTQHDLVYADLDLDEPVILSQGILSIRRTSQTDYVEIDFTKKAQPLPAEKENEQENIYINS